MKASSMALRFGILTAILLAIVGVLIVTISTTGDSLEGKASMFGLVRPAFAQSAEASFLEEEAGMAAYINVGQTIDLSRAKGAYRTVEKETETYIVGSIALPDYPASEDVHAYIHKDGWVVTYYSKEEPTSKSIDWASYSPGRVNTKQELALSVIGNRLGVTITGVKYYHFAYPLAARALFAADSDELRITIPSGLQVYERSYSIADIDIFPAEGRGSDYAYFVEYGLLSIAQLSPDAAHNIEKGNYWLYIDGEAVADMTASNGADNMCVTVLYKDS